MHPRIVPTSGTLATRLLPFVVCLAMAPGCTDDEDRQLPIVDTAPAAEAAEKPTGAECEELGRALVSVRMQTVTTDRAQHEANLTAALGADFVASCQARLPRREVLCGRAAKDLESLAACSLP